VSAARAAQSGRARGAPKGRDGAVEAVRALMADGRSARSERTQANGQARALIVTGPEDLRARFAAHATADLVTDLASLRPRPGAVVGYHTRIALRELGRRGPGSDVTRVTCVYPLVALLSGSEPRPERRVSDISQTQDPLMTRAYPKWTGAAVVLLGRPIAQVH